LAIDEINILKPDILFLDIQMPVVNGFEVIKALKEPIPEIIFVTAYDAFAMKAFRFNAVDYLVKPIETSELKEAVEKVLSKVNHQVKVAELPGLLNNIKMLQSPKPKFAIPTLEGVEYVPIEEIIHCKADDNYTHIFLTNNKTIIASKTLKEFELFLKDFHFFRIHHSHLINSNHIRKYLKSDGGYLQMENGDTLPISRSRKEALIQKLGL
jgi:two-component system LytT family response regulator